MAFRVLEVQLKANVASFQAQLGAAARSTKDFGNEVGRVAASSNEAVQTMGKVGVVAGGAIVAGFGLAIREASRFETGMRNANSIMKQSESEFRATSEAVLDISRKVPQAATTLADGLYDIASSGFQGGEGLEILEHAAVAATAGMTDTATSAKAITAVLNAYGQEASEAADISDVLFQTVNLGVVTFEELASGVGDWVGTAAALKVPVDEASAALATMTLSGIGASEAATSLNRVMQSFVKPGEEMTALINELGYESGVAMVESLGLAGAVNAIDDATKGSVTATAELYGEVRAIKGILALTAGDGKNYAEVLRQITDEGERAGAAQAAYEEQSKSFSVQMDLAKSSITAVAIEVGTVFIPIMTSGAQIVGSLADGFSSLPGPARAVVVGLTGVAGVMALTGGAAILAAPKIARYRAAMTELEGTRVAGALSKTTTGFSKVGAAVGYASPLLVGVGLVMHQHAKTAREAEARVSGYRDAIMEAGDAAKGTTDHVRALIAEDADAAAFLDIAGTNADKLGAALGGTNEEWEVMRARLIESGEAAGLSAMQLKVLPEALDRMRSESQEAASDAEILNKVLKEDQVEAFKAASAEAEALGINLDETSDLAALTGEEMAELAASVDPVIFAWLEMGAVTVEQAKAGQDAMDAYVSSVKQAFSTITSPTSIHSELLASQEEASRAHAEELASIENESIDERAGALREAAEETARIVKEEADDHIRAAQLTGQAAADVRRAAKGKADGIRASVDEEIEALNDGKASWEDFSEHQVVSLEDFVSGLQATNEKVRGFAAGIQEAITRGYDPQIIADLLAAGPEAAAPMLETLLSDHSGTMVGLVNDGAEALQEINMQAAEMARLMHLATTSATDELVRDLDNAMALVQANMAAGGEKSAAELAKELGIGLDDVERIVDNFRITIGENAIRVPIGIDAREFEMKMTSIRGQLANLSVEAATTLILRDEALAGRFAEGGITAYAAGGISPAHITHREIIKYGEPATGGEAFIPRRGEAARSMGILETAAGWYGATVVSRADGGYAGGALPDRSAMGGRPMVLQSSGPSIDYGRLASEITRSLGNRDMNLNFTLPAEAANGMAERDLGRELESAMWSAGIT